MGAFLVQTNNLIDFSAQERAAVPLISAISTFLADVQEHRAYHMAVESNFAPAQEKVPSSHRSNAC
jgi:hypothetical protein